MAFAPRRAMGHEVVPWFLIALAPPIFALATWNFSDPMSVVQRWLKLSGAPVAAIEIVFILWAARSGFAPLQQLRAAPRSVQAVLAILVAIAFGTAMFVASDRPSAALRAVLLLLHILFGLSVAWQASRNSASTLKQVWPAMVAGLFCYVLVLICYVAAIPDPLTFNWRSFHLAVSNVRQVGFYAAIGAATALGLAVSLQPTRSRLIYAAAATIFFALAFWSGTRGVPIAVWAACLCGLIWFPRLRSIRTGAAVLTCTVIGALLSLIHTVPDRHFGLARIQGSAIHREADQAASGRLRIWEETWNAFLERPWFGHGQAQFREMSRETLWATYNHPHNVLLQALFDWGVMGAGCLMLLAWFLFGHCRRALNEPMDLQLPAFLVGSAMLIMALYEGATFHTYTLMMIALSIAWVIGTGRRGAARNGTRDSGQ